MIDVKNLSARYGKHQACTEVSLHVKPAEIVVILGANGAGKSTLLKAIAGVCEGEVHGTVTLNGTGVVGKKPNEIVDMGVALVPENRGIFANLPVIENLRLGAYTARARDHEAANLALVHELFPKLEQRRNQIVRTMSGGEQQMVAIGRAMMSAPTILMLDEPSLGLSPLLSKDLFSRLKSIRAAGIGILLVEQNAKGSLAIADRGYVLENGRITHGASAGELREDPSVQQAYLGAAKGKGGGQAKPLDGVQGTADAPPQGAVVARTPRPGTANPSDIALAAMSQFSSRRASSPPQPVTPAPVPPQPQPAPPPPKPVEIAEPVGVSKPPSGDVPAIADLVSQAETRMRSSRRSALPPSSRRQTDAQAAPRAPTVPAPSPPSSNANRLQQMLADMEQAAHRAQAYRSSKRKDV